jgi:hypothetical protein
VTVEQIAAASQDTAAAVEDIFEITTLALPSTHLGLDRDSDEVTPCRPPDCATSIGPCLYCRG